MTDPRTADLKWFGANRAIVSTEHSGKWIVIHDGTFVRAFNDEGAAVEFSINEFGINAASVFEAIPNDRYTFIGFVS